MSGKGNCFDNAPMESFWGTLKQELVHHRHYRSRQEAIRDITEYIEIFYNRQRRQARLGLCRMRKVYGAEYPTPYKQAVGSSGRWYLVSQVQRLLGSHHWNHNRWPSTLPVPRPQQHWLRATVSTRQQPFSYRWWHRGSHALLAELFRFPFPYGRDHIRTARLG